LAKEYIHLYVHIQDGPKPLTPIRVG
jgi:hypothetical protein